MKLRVNGESKHRSIVCPKTLNPQWQFDSSFHVVEGSIEEREGDVLLEVYDRDHFSGNEFLGLVQFRTSELLRRATVAAYFDLLNKDQTDKTAGEVCVIATHGEEKLEPEERAELLDHLQRQLKLKIQKGKAMKKGTNTTGSG